MITILTSTVPATDTKGTRVIARFGEAGWGGKRHTASWNYEMNHEMNHEAAALALYQEHGVRRAVYVGSGSIGHARRAHLFRLVSNP